MEHISQTNNVLIYTQSDFLTIYSSAFFQLCAGIVFTLIYILKGPFYWLLNPKYPAPRSIALIIGVLLLSLGIRELLTTPISKVIFDKNQQKMILIEDYFIKDKNHDYLIKNIKTIAIIRGDQTAHDYYYYLVLNLKDGKKIQLGEYSEVTDENYKSVDALKKDGQRIASFIKVPFITK